MTPQYDAVGGGGESGRVLGRAIEEALRDDFMPLPNAERFAPNEEINLVRMELPRSSMIALGFTVSEERESETVEADVMLDADGVARAVRFLDRDKFDF